MKMAVESFGLEVVAVGGGREALKAASGQHFSLVLLDVDMPEMNGLEVFRALRKRHGYEKTPIVFITGASAKAIREEAFRLGAADYLVKPVNLKSLRDCIFSKIAH